MFATVYLSKGNMGEATEEDFGGWVRFVSERLSGIVGFDVRVDSRAFSDRNEVRCNTDEQEQDIRDAVERLWDQWLKMGAPR